MLGKLLPSTLHLCPALMGLSLIACSPRQGPEASSPPMVPGATFVGNQACAACHPEITRKFPGSVHARHFREDPGPSRAGGCESCHGAGSRHAEAPFDKDLLIVNPGKDPGACLDCHQEVQASFQLPHHHAVLEGQINCVHCHDPHEAEIFKPSGAFGFGQNQCAQCHREQSRDFLFVHEAMQEGCVLCHQPHGSIHEKMLLPPDSHLCLRCHAQVQSGSDSVLMGKTDHRHFLRQGHCWTAGCHTAVHGSMVSPKLLH